MKNSLTELAGKCARTFTVKIILTTILFLSIADQSKAQTTDTTPPEVINVTVTPSIIDTTSSSQNVILTVHATDAGNGVKYISISYQTPTTFYTSFELSAANLISGSIKDGIYRVEKIFPRYSKAAKINIGQIQISDDSNFKILRGTELAARNFNTELQVISDDEDLVPPEVSDFSFTPSLIDTTYESRAVNITVRATDAKAGVQSVSVSFSRPGDDYSASVYMDSRHRISGDEKDGIYKATLIFRQGEPAGIYNVNVYVTDPLRNMKSYQAAKLAELGYPFQLQIIRTFAATVTISGRVAMMSNRGIFRAQVSLIEPDGNVRYAMTNQFGYYRFEQVKTRQSYTLKVNHKRFSFTSQIYYIDATKSDLNFTANP